RSPEPGKRTGQARPAAAHPAALRLASRALLFAHGGGRGGAAAAAVRLRDADLRSIGPAAARPGCQRRPPGRARAARALAVVRRTGLVQPRTPRADLRHHEGADRSPAALLQGPTPDAGQD